MKFAILLLSFFCASLNVKAQNSTHAAKTTVGGARWYSYGDYLDRAFKYDFFLGGAHIYVATYNPVIWSDTTNTIASLKGTSYTYEHNHLLSLGTVFHPQFDSFGRPELYAPGPVLKVDSGIAYTIDSVRLSYFYYGGTKATPGHTDTLRLAFNIGDLSVSSSIFYDSMMPGGHYAAGTKVPNVTFDSVLVTSATGSAGVPTRYMDILLHASDVSSSKQVRSFEIVNSAGIPTPLAVPGSNIISCVMTFKSGDPAAILHSLPGDTLTGVGGKYYNVFQPDVNYVTIDDPTSIVDPEPNWWFPYDSTNVNSGLFATNPNRSNASYKMMGYIPTLAFIEPPPSTFGGLSRNQYPDIGYHIVCPSCTFATLDVRGAATKWDISLTPNPANEKLNINYSIGSLTDVIVSLTNSIGQVVVRRQVNNTGSGNIIMNTSTLPSGMYIYKVQANGQQSTGKVLIEH